ncbi:MULTISPECIES: ATP-binding protein [unclassified Thiomonas]|uniref:Sensor protein n=1 Tax=mine drainage metagenome TaxID=410659 RepID=E6PP26_9ZZZZ|nr:MULTISPECIES: ATP-binding protein [unclassified Thiomonas]CQR43061.1 Sensor protein [Thiomonas sp. CB3]CDW93711.1 Signal transduction histidine kinase HoxJ (hydrogenase regulation) [Thiomonas sp. CB2]VDY04882.1 PAS/PAC sensor signal transduction histidine kinase [Thiomonas sp. Bio17B3]VDY07948.1 PAS/PAC sensor signal transduction histidine kinase [Thiomonas sp. Sup16B3]VDY13134.1 Signal transduction histidine kinase HoxJ (Hydrogenase regulation) [Thiomonas sp. OC7]
MAELRRKALRESGVPTSQPAQMGLSEEAWIEVIHRMDEIYADLVRYQVDLEEKNAALEEVQRFIDSVLSSMSDVLVVADVQGRIQRANKAMVNLLGRSEAELVGTNLSALFSTSAGLMIANFPDHIRTGDILDCEIEILAAGGEAVPLAVNCSPRYDSEGTLSGMVITGRPLGELRRAYRDLQDTHRQLKTTQQQLLQSEKMASLGRLVAGVAHELNNPISFVFGNMHTLKRYGGHLRDYLELVQRGATPDVLEKARVQNRIDRILKNLGPLIDGSLEGAERVSDIVQNLRRFVTPQRQKRRTFDLCRLVESSLTWVSKAVRQTPQIHLDMPAELPVHGGEGYVQQILINLIQNAYDAMEGRGQPRLDLRVAAAGDFAQVQVRDHGPGIAEDNLLRVFDPFFTTKAVGKGTGLGLYISYGLATDQCAGALSVRNHPDGGAEFTLDIPMEAQHG